MSLANLQKLKSILKEDKDESHTYWALNLLSILCGISLSNNNHFIPIILDKEESVIETLVHMKLEEVIGGLIKKRQEAAPEFHIMLHQILGHMTMTDHAVRKFYAKEDLFLSLIQLLNSQNAGIVQCVLSIVAILLMSVCVNKMKEQIGR